MIGWVAGLGFDQSPNSKLSLQKSATRGKLFVTRLLDKLRETSKFDFYFKLIKSKNIE